MYTSSKRYPESVDFFRAISRSGIEHLEINPERIVLIFADEVVLIQVTEATLTAEQEIEIKFSEIPRSTTDGWASFTTQFERRLDGAISMTQNGLLTLPRNLVTLRWTY